MPKSSSAVWRRHRFPSLFAALALVAAVSACDSSTGNDEDVAIMVVTPTSPTLLVGQVQQMVASPTTSGGRIVDADVSWSSDATGVATVSETGLLTGVAGGTANITATGGGESATVAVTVWFPEASVAITPAGGLTSIREEDALQFSAVIVDGAGATVTGRQLVWSSSDPAIAEVTQGGRVLGRTEGDVVITATANSGVSDSFEITVAGGPLVATVTLAPTLGRFMAPGMTDQFVAIARAASGTILDFEGRTVVWTSSDEAVATVSATGLVTQVAEGEADIDVSVDGVAATADVTVEGYPELEDGVPIVNGTIELGESVFFVLDVPANTANMRIQLGGDLNAGADADIFLYSPAGAFLQQSAAGGSNETINRALPATGRFLIEVNAWDGADEASSGTTITFTLTPVTP